MRQVGRDIPLTRLTLSPLTADDVGQLIRTMAAIPDTAQTDDHRFEAAERFGLWLFSETGGLPFFTAELLQIVLERDGLTMDEDDEPYKLDAVATINYIESQERLPLPPNVREIVLARLGPLNEISLAWLTASTVLGRECSFERLCEVAGVDEFEGLSALETLLNHRLMKESEVSRRPYGFSHDIIREVVYTEAGAARRRFYHRRALHALAEAKAPPALSGSGSGPGTGLPARSGLGQLRRNERPGRSTR
ncbi:MAG: hypothetical protein R3264_19135 [Anaerolineae bacterium]|nr:hypothetical protein [Anaerolineae bacterium]